MANLEAFMAIFRPSQPEVGVIRHFEGPGMEHEGWDRLHEGYLIFRLPQVQKLVPQDHEKVLHG